MRIIRDSGTSNPVGSVRILEARPDDNEHQEPRKDNARGDEPNPRHYEDFNRPTRGNG